MGVFLEESERKIKADLLARIQNGDKSAEEELVGRYWKSLHYILNRRCKDSQLAADLTQDTFIIVISKARDGEISEPGALAGFIRQTGINLSLGYFRKERRRATDPASDSQAQLPDTTSRNDVSRLVESRQALSLVTQVINSMPIERDRQILRSYYMEERDKHKICERLNLSSPHFDRVLSRARTRLKGLIQEAMGEQNVVNW